MNALSLKHINDIAPYEVRESATDLFTMLSSSIVDADGVINYATLILRNDNPRFTQVVEEYTKSIQLLSQKPE